jgi:hypothetical protein
MLAFALSVLTLGSSKGLDLLITSFVFLLLITRLTTESHRRFMLSACADSFEQFLKGKGAPSQVLVSDPSHTEDSIPVMPNDL